MRSAQYEYSYGAYSTGRFGAMRDDEKKQLRRQSIRAGLCLIAFFLIQYALVILLCSIPTAWRLYQESPAVKEMVEMLIYCCSMFLPFFVAYRLMSPQEQDVCSQFGKPTSAAAAAAAVVACFSFCTIGDYGTNMLLDFLEQLGFTVSGGTYDVPATAPDLVSSILQIAVLPALVEEFAMRCVVLQPMRRFGDRYAVVMSAVVFALMHGNLVQIPFAFVAGLAFGYYTIAAGSIWVGVLAHFVNNVYSVLLNYLVETRPTAADSVYRIVLSVTIVAGILCVVLFWKVLPHHKAQRVQTALSGGEKTTAYLFTIPMVIAVIYLVVQTAMLIDYTGV